MGFSTAEVDRSISLHLWAYAPLLLWYSVSHKQGSQGHDVIAWDLSMMFLGSSCLDTIFLSGWARRNEVRSQQ